MTTYNILVMLEIISMFLLALETGYLFSHWRKKSHSYLFMYCGATFINNLGYLMEMLATNSNEAFLGTRVAYLGKVFIPVSLFFFITSFCDVKLPYPVKATLVVIHSGIYALVFSATHHKLFYTSITYTDLGAFPHNVYGHGLFYTIYMVMVLFYFFYALVILTATLIFADNKKKRMKSAILLATIIISIASLIIFMTGATQGYDLTALAYMVSGGLMFIAISRYDLLETVDVLSDYVDDNLLAALIAVDSEGKIIYYNKPALEMYPHLEYKDEDIVEIIKDNIEHEALIKRETKIYKPFVKNLVHNHAVLGQLYILDDITDEYNYTRQLRKAAITDGLTGLNNRAEISRHINEAIGKSIGFHLIMIDIDNFKSVNDSYGHDEGDNVIKGLAKVLRNIEMENKDTACGRWGGEEFMVCVLDDNIERVKLLAETIRVSFSQIKFDYAGNRTVSVGVTTSALGDDINTVTKRVDEALYTSKTEGKNRVTILNKQGD